MKMKRKWKIFSLPLILLILLCFGNLYISKHFLTVTHYEVSTKNLRNAIRIVQVTDLHNSQFGDHNEQLVEMTAEQETDLIVLTGDLVNSDEQDISILLELVSCKTACCRRRKQQIIFGSSAPADCAV